VRAPLADVVVVELSATPLAAAAGVMFADLGATVTWSRTARASRAACAARAAAVALLGARQALAGRVVARQRSGVAADSASIARQGDRVRQRLGDARARAARSRPGRTLRARYPQLVLANGTTFGTNASATLPASDVAAFWGGSGLASVVAGAPLGDVPTPPPHFGALVASVQLFAGAAASLFHLRRTGEGQRTDVNLLRSGLFGQSALGLVTFPRAPEKAKLFMQDPTTRRLTFLVPTAHCLVTKDGFWVQLLGAELPRHFMRTTTALRVPKVSFFARLAWIVLTRVMTSKQKELSQRVLPAMTEINKTFIYHMSQLTFAEVVAEFKKHDVWHTVIRMPRNFRAFEQAHVNGAFQVADDGAFVTSIPFDIGERASAAAGAPALGSTTTI
jgi:crotonobetainyl-CoA:carnitine CoA-transferase CaiB-like acyl-CoA transferase